MPTRSTTIVLASTLATALIAAAVVTASGSADGEGTLLEEERAALAELDLVASQAPVSGYLPDSACARCHARIASDYRSLGMSRSFSPPSEARWIEDFADPEYHHEASGRTYRMERRGERLVFSRHQTDADGERLLEVALDVDWILGSGSVSRTYLVATPSGELFQLPIAWYTQENAWGMAPGFDEPGHLGLNRAVRRECMFCHNGYPLEGEALETGHQVDRWAEAQPHGIGCQRCHGPGARHVAAVQLGASPAEVSARIVNPATLDAATAREVCLQCHYQPTPALARVRRFGRHDFDFRPGEQLDDYMTMLDVVEPGREHGERFEINHHGYRLEQSACYSPRAEAMLCTACHDPHRKPSRPAVLARVRQVCLDCHGAQSAVAPPIDGAAAGSLVASASEGSPSASSPMPLPDGHQGHAECSSCHMPRRRAEDVVHAVMTDHRIPLPASDAAALVAPLPEKHEQVEDVLLIRPSVAAATDDLYRAVTAVRAGAGGVELVRQLEGMVSRLEAPPHELLHDLAKARIQHGLDPGPALSAALIERPEEPELLRLRAVHSGRSGQSDQALADLRRAAELEPWNGVGWANLGRVEQATGELEASIVSLRRAVELRPNLAAAWFWLARSLARSGRPEEALAAGLRSLAVEPTYTAAYQFVVLQLRELGRSEEADRYLEHGLRWATEPDSLRAVAAAHRPTDEQ